MDFGDAQRFYAPDAQTPFGFAQGPSRSMEPQGFFGPLFVPPPADLSLSFDGPAVTDGAFNPLSTAFTPPATDSSSVFSRAEQQYRITPPPPSQTQQQHDVNGIMNINDIVGPSTDLAMSMDGHVSPPKDLFEDDCKPDYPSRRKAQNRAAQRAFRARKETHLKQLEAQIALLEGNKEEALTENQRLRGDLEKATEEIRALRAAQPPEAPTTESVSFSPAGFLSSVLAGHENKSPVHRIVTTDTGERLLSATAVWDLIQDHELHRQGMVDIEAVSLMLRGIAKCDGQGPVFAEGAVRAVIENSVASGTDGLL